MKQVFKKTLTIITIVFESLIFFLSIDSLIFYFNNAKDFHFGTEVIDKSGYFGIIYYSKGTYISFFALQLFLSLFASVCLLLGKRRMMYAALLLQLCLFVIAFLLHRIIYS